LQKKVENDGLKTLLDTIRYPIDMKLQQIVDQLRKAKT